MSLQHFRSMARPMGRQPGLLVAATSAPAAWPFAAFTSRPRGAPWWALLISGLGLGSAVALLLRLLAWWRNYQRFQALRQLRVHELSDAAATAPGTAGTAPAAPRLAELVASLKSHAEETREATASLRRSVEQQQRLYQVAAMDFHRKLEEASKRRGLTSRMEVAPESMQLLRSLVTCKQGAPRPVKENGDLQRPDADATGALQGLLRSGSAAEVKKALQTLAMILQNLTSHPTQEKYKEVSTSSLRFRETFGEPSSEAGEILKLAGFERQGDNFKWANGRPMAEAERIRDLLQDALREERYKVAKESPRKEEPAVVESTTAPWASAVVQQQLSKLGPA